MIRNHKVDRKDRLTVDLTLKFPNPNHNKSYDDNRRHYLVKVDIEEPLKVVEEGLVQINLRLRSLVTIRKMFGTKIDSSLTYRVGENFALLRIHRTTLRISYSFEDDNIFDVFDNSSHIRDSRILESVTEEEKTGEGKDE